MRLSKSGVSCLLRFDFFGHPHFELFIECAQSRVTGPQGGCRRLLLSNGGLQLHLLRLDLRLGQHVRGNIRALDEDPCDRAIAAEDWLVDKIEEIAREKGVTTSQLALAWVLANGQDIVPIPGTKRRKYLEQNAQAAEIILSQEELAAIEDVFPKDAAAGLRYPEAMMKSVNG